MGSRTEGNRLAPTRAQLDATAWRTIHQASVVRDRRPSGYAASFRPANYRELGQKITDTGDFELSWSEFLHEFYRFRTEEFFAERPPEFLSLGWQALLAGTAEFLSQEFGLTAPDWVNDPQYTLPEMWDPWEEIVPDIEQFRDERIAKSHPIFLKRNVVFETRNLIVL